MPATMQRAELTQLREKRHDAFEAMQAINDLQEKENRALTAEETRQYSEYETAVDRMDAQISEHVDLATTAGFIPVDGAVHRDGRIEGRVGEVLGRETRVADWTAKRNMALGRASFGEKEAAEFRFGRLVAGMVTGNWKGAELERRAYAEGVGSTGGFAVPEILGAPRVIVGDQRPGLWC